MHLAFLKDRFQENGGADAVIWRDRLFDYSWLLRRMEAWEERLSAEGIRSGSVVSLEGDFTPNSIALLLALIDHGAIVVPLLTTLKEAAKERFFEIAMVEHACRVDENDDVHFERFDRSANHAYFETLREQQHPGLVLFTSGTSGEPKAAVHDLLGLLEKFKARRSSLRTLNFLLFDHWGGLNTLLHTLSNASAVITVADRSPDGICEVIETRRIELLPTSPTFLNLLLLSGAYKRHDLSSLRIISYGTEPMPMTTLQKLKTVFPEVQLRQTYGLIELGVLRSRSKDDGSLWMKLGGEGYQTRVVDGVLQIKAKSAMLGYLNAPSPFTEDGWFDTKDSVEVEGDYLRVLGRTSEIINVGGEKVYPAEVEDVILQAPEVADVCVYDEKNPITGQIVCARITLEEGASADNLSRKIKELCRSKLQAFKVPVRITVAREQQHSDRFKKVRRDPASSS